MEYQMENGRDIAELVKVIAPDMLKKAGYKLESPPKPVNLKKIAKILDVSITYVEPNSNFWNQGSLIKIESDQPDFFLDKSEAKIWEQSIRSRFTLAHELAHQSAGLYLTPQQSEKWEKQDWEKFSNELAGNLILPDSLLRAVIGNEGLIKLTPQWISKISQQLQVSLSCLIKRLNDAARYRMFQLANCAMIITPDLSSKTGINYAPRILDRCNPVEWYIPVNKRLSSLRLYSLLTVFKNAKLYVPGVIEDEFKVWEITSKRYILIHGTFNYIIYYLERESKRLMLTTFDKTGD
jgi:hypothetical protein